MKNSLMSATPLREAFSMAKFSSSQTKLNFFVFMFRNEHFPSNKEETPT